MKYKISFDRESCIGCGACAAVYPERFEFNAEDGKSSLKNSKRNEKGFFEIEIEDKELETAKNAAESCPVNAIHLVEIKTGKEII